MTFRIIIVGVIAYSISYAAQSQEYWSKTFRINEVSEEVIQCHIWNGDIYVFGNGAVNGSTIQGIRLDPNGEILDAMLYNKSGTTSMLFKPALSFHNDKLLVSGDIIYNGRSRTAMIEIDLPDFTKYKTHVLEFESENKILQDGHQKLTDDQILFYGDIDRKGKLLCTNLQGEEVWEINLNPNPEWRYSIAYPLSPLNDSVWIGIMHERNTGPNCGLFLIGINNKGELVFENDLGWPYVMRYHYPSLSQVHTINDTSFLFTLNTILSLGPIEQSPGKNPRIIAMDTTYQELWRIFNDDNDFLYEREIIRIGRLRNKNFLGVGTKYMRNVEQWEGFRTVGWIFSFSPQGELLWERHYFVPKQYVKFLYNFAEDEDGSIVVVGSTRDSIPNQNDKRFTNNWVLRLDSLGCLTPGCTDSILVLTAYNNIEVQPEILIHSVPNPVSDILFLDWNELPTTQATLVATDLNGKIIGSWSIDTHIEKMSIDVSALPRGVAIFSLRGANWMSMPKKIILK